MITDPVCTNVYVIFYVMLNVDLQNSVSVGPYKNNLLDDKNV